MLTITQNETKKPGTNPTGDQGLTLTGLRSQNQTNIKPPSNPSNVGQNSATGGTAATGDVSNIGQVSSAVQPGQFTLGGLAAQAGQQPNNTINRGASSNIGYTGLTANNGDYDDMTQLSDSQLRDIAHFGANAASEEQRKAIAAAAEAEENRRRGTYSTPTGNNMGANGGQAGVTQTQAPTSTAPDAAKDPNQPGTEAWLNANTTAITDLYKELFGPDRVPSEQAIGYWIHNLGNGQSITDVRNSIMASSEYQGLTDSAGNPIGDPVVRDGQGSGGQAGGGGAGGGTGGQTGGGTNFNPGGGTNPDGTNPTVPQGNPNNGTAPSVYQTLYKGQDKQTAVNTVGEDGRVQGQFSQDDGGAFQAISSDAAGQSQMDIERSQASNAAQQADMDVATSDASTAAQQDNMDVAQSQEATAAGQDNMNVNLAGQERASDNTRVGTQEEMAANQLRDILSQDGALMQLAAQDGIDMANRVGLRNSSLAAGAMQREMARAATPIAMQDAATNFQMQQQNQSLESQRRQFNAGQANQTSQFNAGSENAATSQEFASEAERRAFNAGQSQQNNQVNAAAENAATSQEFGSEAERRAFNAGQQQQSDQVNDASQNAATSQEFGTEAERLAFNAGQNQQNNQFNASNENAATSQEFQTEAARRDSNAQRQTTTSVTNAGMANETQLSDRNREFQYNMQQLAGDQDFAKQELAANKAIEMANIEGQYNMLISDNAAASSIVQSSYDAIADVISNPEIFGDEASEKVNFLVQNLEDTLDGLLAFEDLDLTMAGSTGSGEGSNFRGNNNAQAFTGTTIGGGGAPGPGDPGYFDYLRGQFGGGNLQG